MKKKDFTDMLVDLMQIVYLFMVPFFILPLMIWNHKLNDLVIMIIGMVFMWAVNRKST